MLAPEFILFMLLDMMVLVWTNFEVLVNRLIESDPQQPHIPAQTAESSELRKAA